MCTYKPSTLDCSSCSEHAPNVRNELKFRACCCRHSTIQRALQCGLLMKGKRASHCCATYLVVGVDCRHASNLDKCPGEPSWEGLFHILHLDLLDCCGLGMPSGLRLRGVANICTVFERSFSQQKENETFAMANAQTASESACLSPTV